MQLLLFVYNRKMSICLQKNALNKVLLIITLLITGTFINVNNDQESIT